MNKNFFVFTGEEDFLLRQRVADWKHKFLEKYQSDINLVTLDAAKVSWSQIMAECSAAPFLGDKRLIFVENIESKLKEISGKESASQKKYKSLQLALERLTESTVCIFVMPKIDKRTAFYKYLQKKAQIEVFARLEEPKLKKWITSLVQQENCSISYTALNQIVGLYTDESTLWKIHAEVQKCILYAQSLSQDTQPEITDDVVLEVLTKNYEAQVFDFTDAVGKRDIHRSFALLQQFIAAGADVFYLFHMMVRHFRILTIIQSAQVACCNKAVVCKQFGIHPYAYSKMVGQTRLFAKDELMSIQSSFLELDLKMKQGKLGSNSLEQADAMGLFIEKWIIKYLDKKFDKNTSFLYTHACSFST
jgi:DNA polymerase-3 subunit delta